MKSLASALRQLGRVVRKSESKVTKLTVVAHRPGEAMLSAADGKACVWMSVWIPVQDHGAQVGEIALPSEQLAGILATAQAPELILEHDESGSTIKAGSAEWKLSPIDLSTVAAIPDTGGRKLLFASEPEVLSAAVGSVQHAVAKEGARFTMTGMLVESTAQSVHLVCTDGRRLAIRTMGCEPKSAASLLVPPQAIQSLIWDDADMVEVYGSRNHVRVVWKKDSNELAVLTASLLEGKFPDYRLVVPKEPAPGCVHQLDELKSAIKQVACVSDLNRVDIEYTPGKVVLTSASTYGKAQVEVACEHNLSAKFAVNSQYMLEALDAVDGQTATISLSKQPSIIIESEGLYQLVMPLS